MNPRSKNMKKFYMLLHALDKKAFTYYTNDETTGNITTLSYISNKPDVVVPTSIDGFDLDVIGIHTFMGNTNITSVSIPNTITSID